MPRFRTGGAALMVSLLCGLSLVRADGWQKESDKSTSKPRRTEAEEKALENYRRTCQPCHGPEGRSLIPGMELAGRKWKHGTSLDEIVRTITEGVPGTVMVPNKDKFTPEEIGELARLVRSFDPTLNKE
jgi:mono/diheme cytochrome c family protein